MTEITQSNGTGKARMSAQGAEQLVRAIGKVLSNMYLYGPSHGVTTQAMNDCFTALSGTLDLFGEISFRVNEGILQINETLVESRNPLVKSVLERMLSLDGISVSVTLGMEREKFERLMALLNASPDELCAAGGFLQAVADGGFEHVRTRKVIYREIDQDDRVVSKEKATAGGGGGAGSECGEYGAEVEVDHVLAFLRGDISGDSANVSMSIDEAASDTKSLAELILHTACVQQEKSDLSGAETLAGLVVGCLRRTYEGLSKDPAAKTQKGKKSLARSLLLLESELLDKMREMADGVGDDAVEAVTGAVEEMCGELKIGALAAEYMKKRNAIDATEEKILKHIKSKKIEDIEDSELRERLQAGGLSSDGWQELLLKAGISDESSGGVGVTAFETIGRLSMLLSQVQDQVNRCDSGAEGSAKQELKSVLSDIGQEVGSLANATMTRIEELTHNVRADEAIVASVEERARKEGKDLKFSRKRLLELFAELGQEICQPIAVITCTLDMLRSESMRQDGATAESMLDLAKESAIRVRVLINKMIEIAGIPDSMNPDADIQKSLHS